MSRSLKVIESHDVDDDYSCGYFTYYICPNDKCKEEYLLLHYNYCFNCGCKLDWSNITNNL